MPQFGNSQLGESRLGTTAIVSETASIGISASVFLTTTVDENQVSGTVTLNGSGVQGATVRVIDQNTDTQIASATTDSNGDYGITVDSGLTVHVTVEYEDGSGNQYNDESKPFVTT